MASLQTLAARACVALVAGLALAAPAGADSAVALRVGTLGIGVDANYGITKDVNVRAGFTWGEYDRTIRNTDVTYQGTAKVADPYALFDWFVAGGLRVSFGLIAGGPEVDAVGRPTQAGTFTIDGVTYSTADVTRVSGWARYENSLKPYVGLGFGNPVGGSGRWTFLVDVGALYGGEPRVLVDATCAPTAPPGTCAQLEAGLLAEEQRLREDVDARWYPVVSLGVSYRF